MSDPRTAAEALRAIAKEMFDAADKIVAMNLRDPFYDGRETGWRSAAQHALNVAERLEAAQAEAEDLTDEDHLAISKCAHGHHDALPSHGRLLVERLRAAGFKVGSVRHG